jgi:hypothetical protein
MKLALENCSFNKFLFEMGMVVYLSMVGEAVSVVGVEVKTKLMKPVTLSAKSRAHDYEETSRCVI